METRQLARAVLRGPAAGPTALFGRLFGTSPSPSSFRPLRPLVSAFARPFPARPFSATPGCLDDARPSSPAAPVAPAAPAAPAAKAAAPGAASWPPNRAAPASDAAAADPLKALYASDNPAQWAMWSSDEFYKRNVTATPRGPRLELKPKIGRTVAVNGNVDQARAFALVEVVCGRNRVKSDFMRQRFHERPGIKRKRLKSERWRRKFRASFKATVDRVQYLAQQGW